MKLPNSSHIDSTIKTPIYMANGGKEAKPRPS
ncbi:hypothetical protein Acife_2507 [Acidithiobacillus ferrivorans SS3]|jgi:hypothetical protein|uniref:Uncharacterized protein n=1 Tax=Acidithiobacillus ferrivorans SS3 TaxID=743299 RepID=G0JQ16_9PROT|nr:hypothetical protein Acife_2507 [Acidithiobacillus ferrivorans SS3]